MAGEALGENLSQLQKNPEAVTTLTVEQLGALKLEVQQCVPQNAELCKDVLTGAMNLATGQTKTELSKLLKSLDTPEVGGYSLDALETGLQDEKAKKFLGLYQEVIAKDLETIYGEGYTNLSEVGKENVKLVFWDIIMSQMSLKGATNVALGKITSLTDVVKSMFGEQETSTESVLTAGLVKKQEFLAGVKPELAADIENSIALVESLIGKQANNLKVLMDLSKGVSPEQKAQIFENSSILKAIMKTGVYKDEKFSIDISSGTLEIGELKPEEISQIQSEFFSELQNSSNTMGKTLENLRQEASKAEGFLKQFGMEGGIDEIKATLFGLPVLGVFFKMLLGDFFKEFDMADKLASVTSLVDKLPSSPEKTSLGHLQNFLKTYTDDSSISETPLKKFLTENAGFTPDFYTKAQDFLSKAKEKGVKIDDAQFWEKLLTGKNASGVEQKMFNALKSTLEAQDFSEENFLKALGSLPDEVFVTDTAQVAPPINPDGTPVDPNVVPATPVPFETQILALTGLPASLTLDSGEEIEIGAFDATTSRITLNGRTFEFGKVKDNGKETAMTLKNFVFKPTGILLLVENVPFIGEKEVEIEDLSKLQKTLQELISSGKGIIGDNMGSIDIKEIK